MSSNDSWHTESHGMQGMAHHCSQVLWVLSHMKTCAVHVFTGFSDLKPVFEAEACSSSDMPFLTLLSTTEIYEALHKGDGNTDTNSDLVLLSLKWEPLSSVARLLCILVLPLDWHFTLREAREHIQAAGGGSFSPSRFLPSELHPHVNSCHS